MASHHFKIHEEDKGTRLDVFLSHAIPDVPSRTFVKKLIDHGHVKVSEQAVKANHKLCEGDDVSVEIPGDFLTKKYIAPEDIPLDIFYEDESFLIINKPRGMTVHPAHGVYSGTLVNALLHYSVNLSQIDNEMRPGIVHRLDKETSGLIFVAKDNITHTKIAKQFQRHRIKKQYVALVEGAVEFDEGKIDASLGSHYKHFDKRAVKYDDSAKEAVTFYRVVKRHEHATLVVLYPKTGRTHQLRVHMAHLGHPILGDDKYGRKNTFPRLALHAQSLGFLHPVTQKYVEFSSRLPEEFLRRVGL